MLPFYDIFDATCINPKERLINKFAKKRKRSKTCNKKQFPEQELVLFIQAFTMFTISALFSTTTGYFCTWLHVFGSYHIILHSNFPEKKPPMEVRSSIYKYELKWIPNCLRSFNLKCRAY